MLRVCSEYVQSVFRVCSEYVKSMFRVCSEYVQGLFRVCSGYVKSMFRVCSEYVQSMFRVYSLKRLVVKILVIASSSAFSVSVLEIFLSARPLRNSYTYNFFDVIYYVI